MGFLSLLCLTAGKGTAPSLHIQVCINGLYKTAKRCRNHVKSRVED